jgi:thiamine-monophosphate kinase
MKIRDIGEQGLLIRLQQFCPSDVVGDDAAVIPGPELGQLLVVTTDVLVDKVHFSDRTTSPQDTGWRAAAANLSDLAAMGASPLGITVGLSITSDLAVNWVEQLYQGMSQCLQKYNTPILGGDVCRSSIITISITAFGQVFPKRIIHRSSAIVGDAIVVTGVHGASKAGLELLLNPEIGEKLSESQKKILIQAHQRPKPRLDVLPILWEILDSPSVISPLPDQGGDKESPVSVAGMDSSDGLADAVLQICRASGVGARIERASIPLPPVLNQLISKEEVMNWALYGGEDFELVLCLPQEIAEKLVKHLGNEAAIIGKITPGNEVCLTDSSSTYAEQILSLDRGFQHF